MKLNQSLECRNQLGLFPWSKPVGLLVSLVLLFAQLICPAGPGDVDLSFDPGSTVNNVIYEMVVQSDGKILIGGLFTTVHGAMRTGLARLNPDGSTDESFNAQLAGSAPVVKSIAIQPDGKVLIGGTFASARGIGRSNLVRLNLDSSLDLSFSNAVSDVSLLVLQPDGKILVGGGFTNIHGVERRYLARLNSDGSLDETFLDGLAGPSAVVQCLVIQEDGRILIGGYFKTVNGMPRSHLARLNSDGSLDPAFLDGMSGPDEVVRCVSLQPDNKILVGGLFFSFNGISASTASVLRLNADGALDETFSAEVRREKIGVSRIIVQSDGKIVLGGCLRWPGQIQEGIARLNQDGSRDSTFIGKAPAEDDLGVRAMVQNGDDAVILAGGSMSTTLRPFLWRIALNGARDTNFGNGPSGPDNEVRTVLMQADGRMLLGGRFQSYNGKTRGGIARLNQDGSLDSTFLDGLSGADGNVWAIALQSDARVLIAGEFRTVNGVVHQGIARLNADGSLDDTFSPSLTAYPGNYVYALAVQRDGRIIIGGAFGGNVARLNSDGSKDPSFSASATGSLASVQALVLQPDGRIVIGGFFSTVNGDSRNRIARLNSNGSLDVSFLNGLSGASAAVWALAVQNDGKTLVGGWFETFNGVARKYIVRLNTNGTVDGSFLSGLAGPNASPWCLATQEDGKILVGGGLSSFNGVTRGNLARLHADGSLDGSFVNGQAGGGQGVWCLALLPDKRIVIGGDFSIVDQIPGNSLARLMGDSVAPEISTSPTSQTAETGTSVRLAAHASGVPPPCYQWYCDGSALPDCTNAVLELANLQTAHVGAYTVTVTNISGAVTSAPVMLNVIAPVGRRPVPGVVLAGQVGSLLNLDYTDPLKSAPMWTPWDSVSLTSTSQYYFDLTAPLPPKRFYRAWQTGSPSVSPTLGLQMIPALTLTGNPGDRIRVDAINQYGPTDAWFTLDTVTLTNTMQLYFDVTAPGQPQRLYRLVPGP